MTGPPIEIGMFYTMAVWVVRPGNEDAFIEAWASFARWTAETQPGALTGVLLRDAENPARFVSLGPWRDRQSAMDWRSTEQFRDSFARFRELCSAIEPQSLISVATSQTAP